MHNTSLHPNSGRAIAPRQIAAMIIKQRTRAARSQMLMNSPAEWQALIKKHVEIHYERRSKCGN